MSPRGSAGPVERNHPGGGAGGGGGGPRRLGYRGSRPRSRRRPRRRAATVQNANAIMRSWSAQARGSKAGRPAPARGHRRGPVWVGDSSLTSGECQVTQRPWHRPRPSPVSAPAPAAVTATVAAVIVAVEAPVERVVAVVGIYRTGRGVVDLNIARRLALAA